MSSKSDGTAITTGVFTQKSCRDWAARVEEYWARLGHKVTMRVTEADPVLTPKGKVWHPEHWQVRSDMVDGLPMGFRGAKDEDEHD